MWTSSPSMRKNDCACWTTLASFSSGTPTPPRFNSMRTRKRDMGISSITALSRLCGPSHSLLAHDFSKLFDGFSVQAILDDLIRAVRGWANGLRRVFRQRGIVARGGFHVASLHSHQSEALQARNRARVDLHQAA